MTTSSMTPTATAAVASTSSIIAPEFETSQHVSLPPLGSDPDSTESPKNRKPKEEKVSKEKRISIKEDGLVELISETDVASKRTSFINSVIDSP